MAEHSRRYGLSLEPTESWVREMVAGLEERIARGPSPAVAKNALDHLLGCLKGAPVVHGPRRIPASGSVPP